RPDVAGRADLQPREPRPGEARALRVPPVRRGALRGGQELHGHPVRARAHGMTAALELEPIACPLCGVARATELYVERDLALGVPGRFPLARCEGCGLLYQNPRVRRDQLDRMYPDDYPPHARDADLGRAVSERSPAVRWVLAQHLGYAHLDPRDVGALDRLRAWWRRRRVLKNVPPWQGEGRLLDVGCATGRFLQRMAVLGWRVS